MSTEFHHPGILESVHHSVQVKSYHLLHFLPSRETIILVLYRFIKIFNGDKVVFVGWPGGEVVTQRSAKPPFTGSIPVLASMVTFRHLLVGGSAIGIGIVLIVIILMSPFARPMPIEESVSSRALSDDHRLLLEQLARHMLLPEGRPVIYEIRDPAALAEQPFFANTQEGDQLILYPTTARAIIYSPRRDRIVNIGPITADFAPDN